MAKGKQLDDHLQDLFSDIELPEPDTSSQEEAQPAETASPAEASPAPASRSRPQEELDIPQTEPVTQEPVDTLQTADRPEAPALEQQLAQLQQANYQLQKRAIQLEASTAITQAAASILDPQEFMQTTVDLIRERLDFYHVSFFLLDETGEWAVARASTGKAGRRMVAQSRRLAVGGESMVGRVCASRRPRIALDVGADATHFDNPLLPHTRSEIVLPLRVGSELLGVLDVHSTQEAAFDDDDLRTLQQMADLVAVALENARLFAESRRAMRRQHLIGESTRRIQQATGVGDILAFALQDLGETFELAEATICLGTEAELARSSSEPDRQADDAGNGETR